MLRVGRLVYMAVLFGFVAVMAILKRSEVADLLSGTRPSWILASLAGSFGLVWVGSAFWALALKELGSPVPLGEVVLATARAMPARYLPMGAGLAIGRAAILRSSTGAGSVHLVATALLETAVSVTVALTLGIAVLAASGILPGSAFWAAALLALLAAGVSQLSDAAVKKVAEPRFGVALRIGWSGRFGIAGVSAAYWACNAATFLLYLRAFPAADGIEALEAAGAFMASWAVGFLAVFAFQGIGVVEWGLIALLPVELMAADAAHPVALGVVFGGYRLVHMARDGVVAVAGSLIAMRRARGGSARTG